MRRTLRERIGWMPLHEWRNKVMLGHTALRFARVERAEVRRLSATLTHGVPRALVAVVVPTYRRPVGVVRAVESVLAQTVTDLVVIVVDDGGGLPALPADPRVVGVSLSRNVHVLGVGRNVGIRLTDSDFVAFLDDDNAWYPDHLAVALARLNDRGPSAPDAVYTALRRVRPDGTEFDILSRPFDRRLAANESFLDTNSFVARRLPQVMFSRMLRPPSVFPREDWELMYRLGRHLRVEHIPVATVEYTINPNSYWTDWGWVSSNQGQAPASA